MAITLAFDVYGTLIDTQGVVEELRKFVGNQAEAFAQTWRSKQLEYSFRRGLMQRYEDFSVCISNALDYSCASYKTTLTHSQKTELLDTYRELPIFADVNQCLSQLTQSNYRAYAFSNGSTNTIESLLGSAGIKDFFIEIVSVEETKTFKPNPDVYQYFLQKTESSSEETWLISSNPFDVIGAISAGMKAAWVKRSEAAIFDPWGIEPTITVNSLSGLLAHIDAYTDQH